MDSNETGKSNNSASGRDDIRNESTSPGEASFDHQQARERIASAVAEDRDLTEVVRDLTLDALSGGRLDRDRIKGVIKAIIEDVKQAGELGQGDISARQWREAFAGLDVALKSTAQACGLAINEALGRMEGFARTELKKSQAELETLEDLFLETVGNFATRTKGVTRDILNDLLVHARRQGTQVGEQVRTSVAALSDTLERQGDRVVHAGLQAARHAGADLAQVASGLLAGIAEKLRGSSQSDTPPPDRHDR